MEVPLNHDARRDGRRPATVLDHQDEATATTVAAWLTAPEAALLMRISVKTLANWRSSGSGGPPYHKLGSRCVYRRDDVEAWLAARRVQPRQ
jgi:Helix-turn-helix domain